MDKFNAALDASVLTQLRDIHLPAEINHWWPLAPGWYILMLFLIITSTSAIFLTKRYLSRQYIKKQALNVLTTIEKEQRMTPNSQRASAAVSELLKRVALARYSREEIAGLHGEDWLTFLLSHDVKNAQDRDWSSIRKALLEYPYQPPHQHNLNQLFHFARQWIENQTAERSTHV
ncbi:MAG: DUF4381 domain-containing protein [Legionellaceae bacterium]|nr:DUF4381 domain-containing protein [Legionellaceae bacterium]